MKLFDLVYSPPPFSKGIGGIKEAKIAFKAKAKPPRKEGK
jgi:16S rRNA G966 N2-methylase RsmD